MTRVLLIDTETERAQQVEKRLRLWGMECSVVESFLYALTTLEWQRPDLLLIRAENTDGMAVGEFGALVKQDPTLRDLPLIFVAEPGVSNVAAIRCFDLVLEAPDTGTLVAHLARFQTNCRSTVGPSPEAVSIPEGSPREVDHGEFAAVVEGLTLGLRSGRLVIGVEGHSGQILVVLDHGQIVHAVFGGLEGPPAFRRLLHELENEKRLSCCFEPEPRWRVSTYPRSIQQADRQRLLGHQAQPQDVFDTKIVRFERRNR